MKINESRAPSPLERARLTLCLQNRNNRMKSKVIRKFYYTRKILDSSLFLLLSLFPSPLLPNEWKSQFFFFEEGRNSSSPHSLHNYYIYKKENRWAGNEKKKKNRFPLRYNEKSMEEQPFSFRRIEESKLSNHCQDKDRYAPARSSRRRLYSVLVTW